MDIDYINSNNISGRYLTGKLDRAEEIEFELYLIDHPDYVRQLELEDAFFRILPQLGEKKTSTAKLQAFLDLPLRQFLLPTACCLLVIPIAMLFLNPSTSPSIQPVFLTNDSLRTASETAIHGSELSFSNSDEVLLLLLYPNNEIANEFSISVRDAEDSFRQEFGARQRGSFGYLSIGLSANEIGVGNYIVELLPIDIESTVIESIPFRVVSSP